MNTTDLTQQERDLMIHAMRCAKYAAVDAANGMDRAYGPKDGRAIEAWKKAIARQNEIDQLGAKLGLSV